MEIDGKKAIIDKILAAANKNADAVLSAAEKDAAAARKKAQTAAKEYSDGETAKAGRAVADIVKNRIALAELDIKKQELAARQDTITECFDTAANRIFSDDGAYLRLITDMLKKYAESGDEIIIGQGDQSRITKDFVKKTADALKIALTLCNAAGEFRGGIKLKSKVCDKNLTFESLFKMLRQDIEPKVSDILFG